MKILYIAEIIGKAGVFAVKKILPQFKKDKGIDFVIANGDGTTGGYGLGRNHAGYLRKLGIDIITTGDCCFYKKDLVQNFDRLPYVLRPINLSPFAPGLGSRTYQVGSDKVAVAVLLGQGGFDRLHGDNPFIRLPELLERLRRETPFVILDFHASTTAEKLSLFAQADGLCSAVIGSHARVQTADSRIMPGGTATITDAGRTGSINSVGGTDPTSRIQEYLTGIPDWSRDTWDRIELQALVIDIAPNGKATMISPLRIECQEVPHEGDRKDTED
ncbi:TIGR00282 family metallophosphoesterase [Gracilinema caldarium]|uniref:TIGR00282 family metallophosphoesterase n=1 Tax=Gracilinema caldarium TaxID=215591 RepID=UPI0026F075CC|nr:TIGR00282 family metallophosphoesterase [Gracilinema caldarium]